jgi:phosphopantothenoylcysteine decarboxylase/phosphopantothenate--cysteine ligase
LGEKKTGNQILIGFALETNDEEENALKKLHNKNADCIVLNSLREQGSGFEFDTNKVTLLTADKKIQLQLKHKRDVARDIIQFIVTTLLK